MSTEIFVGDSVRHKIKILNGNVPMIVAATENNQALCEHFYLNNEGESKHTETWFPFQELEKVHYGNK